MRENFIGGTWSAHSAAGGDSVIDPATGEAYDEVTASTAEDVAAAVAAAAAAFPAWAEATPADRSGALLALADRIEHDADNLVAVESRNVGKPIGAAAEELPRAGRQPPLLRRRGPVPRRSRRRRVHGRLHVDAPARPARGRRVDRAVELPADDGDLEDRPGAGRRQHGRAQALGADAAHRAPAGRAVAGRAPARRAQRRHRAGRDGRRRAGRASRTWRWCRSRAR